MDNKILLFIFHLIIFFVAEIKPMKDIFSYQNNNYKVGKNSSLSWSDAKYIEHEKYRSQSRPGLSTFDHLLAQHNLQQLKYDYSLGMHAVEAAIGVNDLQVIQPFIEVYNSTKDPFTLQGNQNTIDKLIQVLYMPNGYPKLESNVFEKYQIARIVTDHFKTGQPNEYLNLVRGYALEGNKEFTQILKEETTRGSWLKYETVGTAQYLWASLKSIFAGTSFLGNAHEFSQVISKNKFLQTVIQLNALCIHNNFTEAKKIIDYYKQIDSFSTEFKIVNNLFNARLEKYCTRVLENFNIKNADFKIKGFIKDAALCSSPLEAAQFFYATLAENQHDQQFIEIVHKFLDERGLLRGYSYNESLLSSIALPKTITLEQIKDRLLLFELALSKPRAEERAIVQNSMHYLAQACSGCPLAKSYSALAHGMINALKNPDADKTILQCGNFLLSDQSQELETLHRRVVPLAANLVNEINGALCSGKTSEEVDKLRSDLLTIDRQYKQFDYTPDTQRSLSETIARLNSELKTFSRPEMFRSPSMEKLFLARVAEFLMSCNGGSISISELTNFSGTKEQNALQREMMHDLKIVSAKADEIKDVKFSEAVKVYNKLFEEAHQLNKESHVLVAKTIFHIARDALLIVETDFPVKEVAKSAFHSITHPQEYASNIVEGYKRFGEYLVACCRSFDQTPEEHYATAKQNNELYHRLYEGWQNLTYEQKKEVVGDCVANYGIGKALGQLPKLISKIESFSKISNSLSSSISSFENSISGFSVGGDGSVAVNKGLIAIKEGVIRTVKEVAAVPWAATTVGVTEIGSLTHAMSNNRNGSGGNLPSESGKQASLPDKISQEIVKYIEPGQGNVIKELTTEIFLKKEQHIFSDDHLDNGIMKLGTTRDIIVEKCANIIKYADKDGFIKEGVNSIITQINGNKVLLKPTIMNGNVVNINTYLLTSENARLLGNVFTYIMEIYK